LPLFLSFRSSKSAQIAIAGEASVYETMSNHHRAIGVKDKGHADNDHPASLYGATACKKHKPDGARMREFAPDPSLMAREISLEAMRSLRMNQVLATLLPRAGQATAFLSSPVAFGLSQNMSRQVSTLASPQWSGMSALDLESIVPMHARRNDRYDFAVNHRPLRNLSELHNGTGSLANQYMHLQQALHREHAGYNNYNGSGGLTSPSLSISQELVLPAVTVTLPSVLSRSMDGTFLTKFQVFLRLHIEVFAATPEDVVTRIRGRHKQIRLHQVGIRCRHCAHIPGNLRLKGAVYFPSSTTGLYQASQNMCSTHLQCGLCPEMPESTKTMFAQLIGTKTAGSSSAGGRAYWGQCAQQMGLVNTELGIFPTDRQPE
jgi:hypothetical protein